MANPLGSTEQSPPRPDDHLAKKVTDGINYATRKRKRFARGATAIRLTTLTLSAAATVILGLADMTPAVSVAFTLTAIVTLMSALEPFFNFRDRWVLMEDGVAKFHRLNDEIEFLRVSRSADAVGESELLELRRRYQQIWEGMSDGWVEARKRGASWDRST